MRQHAVDNVKVSFIGLDLSPGLAVGTSVQETISSEAWSVRPNGMGSIVYMFHPDRSGTLSLQIVSSSLTHTQLLAFYNADLISRSIVGPLYITDKNTTQVAVYNKARILSRPPYSTGTQLPIYSWIFGFETSFVQNFQPNKNLVGS